jgi:hypothetical protein
MTSPNWPGIIDSLRQRLLPSNEQDTLVNEELEPQEPDSTLNSRILERFLREQEERERLERIRRDRERATYREINRGFLTPPQLYQNISPSGITRLSSGISNLNSRRPMSYIISDDTRDDSPSIWGNPLHSNCLSDYRYWSEPQNKYESSDRFKANAQILKQLYHYIYKYPDVRFGQLLVTCGILVPDVTDGEMRIADPFNEESQVTLSNMKDPSGEE